VTALTPPPGVDARDPQIPGVVVEWDIKTGPGSWIGFRLYGPRPEQISRAGRVLQALVPARVEIRTGISSFGPDFTDPDELRRFSWLQLAALHRLAKILEAGMPEPEPDPQLTIDDALAEAQA
jgi:hypothetical protein